MAKEINYFKRSIPHLEKKYGGKKTQAIMAKARARYEAIVEENKDEPKAWYIHTRERIGVNIDRISSPAWRRVIVGFYEYVGD